MSELTSAALDCSAHCATRSPKRRSSRSTATSRPSTFPTSQGAEAKALPADPRELSFVKEALATIDKGGYPEALARVGFLMAHKDEPLPLSRLQLAHDLLEEYRDLLPDLPLDEARRIGGEQEIIARYEPEKAVTTLPVAAARPARPRAPAHPARSRARPTSACKGFNRRPSRARCSHAFAACSHRRRRRSVRNARGNGSVQGRRPRASALRATQTQRLPDIDTERVVSVDGDRCLAGLRSTAALRDGTAVCVRAIRPDDKERLRVAFARLSPRTVYQRFFHPVSELTAEDLRRLTEIDFRDHVAHRLDRRRRKRRTLDRRRPLRTRRVRRGLGRGRVHRGRRVSSIVVRQRCSCASSSLSHASAASASSSRSCSPTTGDARGLSAFEAADEESFVDGVRRVVLTLDVHARGAGRSPLRRGATSRRSRAGPSVSRPERPSACNPRIPDGETK